jgi:cytoskeleton protein RodZ
MPEATPETAAGRPTPASLSNSTSPAAAAGNGVGTVATPAAAGGAIAVPAESVPPRETVARELGLRLELSSDSWVEVYDSRGERLFYDVASAGSVQSVSGRGPLRVVLGNAAGVSVAVDGQAREIPANAMDGDGASFVVNRSGSLSRAR